MNFQVFKWSRSSSLVQSTVKQAPKAILSSRHTSIQSRAQPRPSLPTLSIESITPLVRRVAELARLEISRSLQANNQLRRLLGGKIHVPDKQNVTNYEKKKEGAWSGGVGWWTVKLLWIAAIVTEINSEKRELGNIMECSVTVQPNHGLKVPPTWRQRSAVSHLSDKGSWPF